jgi:membrane protein
MKGHLQKLVFTAERFGQHELANHAAAGAYAFLLSATPAVLLVIGLAMALIGRYPRILGEVTRLTLEVLGPLASQDAIGAFYRSRLGPVAIGVGAISLVWAARLFIVTIQRGIRLIYSASGRNTMVKENVLTFAVELVCLVAVVVILAASQGLELLLEPGLVASLAAVPGAFNALLDAVPVAILYLFVYFTYLVIPPSRPRTRTAALAALACVAIYVAFAALLQFFVNSARYELLYGVFGRLIILLVNVYTFFTLYFYGCELAYVIDHFDALLFARYYRVSRMPGVGRLERALFMEPARLLRAYARNHPKGTVIFQSGEVGRTVYFIYDGEVGIYLGERDSRRLVSTLGPGEVFGEMAHIIDEPRTATAKAESDAILLELPPDVFDLFLRADVDAMRHLADSLATRLKEANLRLSEGALYGGPGEGGSEEGDEGDEGDGYTGEPGDEWL